MQPNRNAVDWQQVIARNASTRAQNRREERDRRYKPVVIGACTCGGDMHYSRVDATDLATARRHYWMVQATDLPVTIHLYQCRMGSLDRIEGCGGEAIKVLDRNNDLVRIQGRTNAPLW